MRYIGLDCAIEGADRDLDVEEPRPHRADPRGCVPKTGLRTGRVAADRVIRHLGEREDRRLLELVDDVEERSVGPTPRTGARAPRSGRRRILGGL